MGSNGIVKLMKVSGCWAYNEKMLKDLDLLEVYGEQLVRYNKNESKAMTSAIVSYL